MLKRISFFMKHLIVSFILALCVMGWVFYIWYPYPLAKGVGVTHIFLMMLIIDVVVGPILGLLVYKEGKKTLKFDLTVIIFLQISALCYGIYSIEQGRPAWMAYNVDRFELIRKNEIFVENISKANKQYQQVSWFKPQFVAVEFAKDQAQRNDDMFAEALAGISLAQRPERYVDFSQATLKIQQRAKKIEELKQYNNMKEVDHILEKYPQATAFLPMKASAVDMTVLVDQSGKVVKIVDLRPWK